MVSAISGKKRNDASEIPTLWSFRNQFLNKNKYKQTSCIACRQPAAIHRGIACQQWAVIIHWHLKLTLTLPYPNLTPALTLKAQIPLGSSRLTRHDSTRSTLSGFPFWHISRPLRPTQPDHPSVGPSNGYWCWCRPPLQKKWLVCIAVGPITRVGDILA